MTDAHKLWVKDNTLTIVGGCFVFFTVLMQILHWCKVNVFKVIVLLGTFVWPWLLQVTTWLILWVFL